MKWGAAVCCVLVAGCTSTVAGNAASRLPTPTIAAPVTSTVVVTSTVPPLPPTTSTTRRPKPRRLYPPGYPKVVPLSSLPYQVRYWYRMGGGTGAVAIAPGVWAEMTPGSSARDAIAAGSFNGFCASIVAYERKYLHGSDVGGTCW